MSFHSIFYRHRFFSDLKSEKMTLSTKSAPQKSPTAEDKPRIATPQNPISERDREIAEKIKPHIQALFIQSENVSHGKFTNPDEVCMSEVEIKTHSLLRATDKEKLQIEFGAAIKNYPGLNQHSKAEAILKTLANFMGGGLTTGGDKNSQLDGFFPEVNFSIWEWLLTSAEAHISAEEVPVVAQIKAGIGQLKKSAHFLSDLCNRPLSPKETTRQIHAASLEYAKKIQKLQAGQSELFNGGWGNSDGSGGHAQIYEIERREDGLLNVLVYTSTGFELTEYFLSGNKLRVKPLIRYEKVPDTVLFFGENEAISPVFLQGLMEIKVLAIKDPNFQVNEQHVLGVLDHLETYRVSVPILEAGAITGQRAGTCVPSVTKQYIRYHVGKDRLHKQLMFHSKLKLLTASYCGLEKTLSEKSPLAEVARRTLTQNARKLLRISVKLEKENLVTQEVFEQARATTHDIINKVEVIETTLAAKRQAKVFQSAWQKASHKVQRKERKKFNPKAASIAPYSAPCRMATPDLSIVIDLEKNCAQVLLSAIQATHTKASRFETFKLTGGECFSVQISHLVDQLPLPGTPEAKVFWDQFSLQEQQKAQEGLLGIARLYHEGRSDDQLARRFATIMPLQALIHFLAVQIDTKLAPNRHPYPKADLSNYKIPCYTDALNLDGLLFFDRQQFNRLMQASDYIKSHNKKASEETLFVSEWGAKVQKEKILDCMKQELNNGHYWKALLDADPKLEEAATAKANELWPDFSEARIKGYPDEVKANYEKWDLERKEWYLNPTNRGFFPVNEPITEIPENFINIPKQTKYTLILDSFEFGENDFLTAQGYGHVTRFRWMNSLANGSMYKDVNYCGPSERTCSARQGNPSSAKLGEFFHTFFSPALEAKISRDGREINQHDKHFLSQSVCKRDISSWNQPYAEGNVLRHSKKTTFLKKLLRPLSQWEIAPEQLIYELEKEWYAKGDKDLLEDPSFHGFFYHLFFRSPVLKNESIELGLGDLIVKNPALREILITFINRGLARIQTTEMSFNSARFFFELSFLSAKYLADAGLTAEAEKFSQLTVIKHYFDHPAKLTPENEAALHLYQVLFYSLKKELTVEARASVFAAWALHQTFPRIESKYKFPAIYSIAYEFILHQVEEASHLPCQELGALVASKVKILPLVEKALWDVDCDLKFPYISDGTSKINLLSGEMYRPEGPVSGVPKNFSWESEQDFVRLFRALSNVRYEALGNDCIGFTHATKGAFRLIKKDDIHLIQRRMEGSWYQYVCLESKNKHENEVDVPSPLIYDHAYWIPVERIDPEVKGIFTDLKQLRPLYQAKSDGSIVELKPDGLTLDYLSGEKADFKGYTKFDPLNHTLTYRKGEALKKLAFPAYCSLDGNTLAFECEEQRLLWSENRDYEICATMQRGVLGTFENYLYLKSTKNSKHAKVLVPLQQIIDANTPTTTCQLNKTKYPTVSLNGNEFASTQRFLAFDCIDGVIKATTLEGRCFLAYIYLAQKRCEEATGLLNGIKASEDISDITKKILGLIQSLPAGEDHPDGKMVRLHAASLLLKKSQEVALEPIEGFFSADLLEIHVLNAADALQNSHSLSAGCRLSEKDEIQLLGQLYAEGQEFYAIQTKKKGKCAYTEAHLTQLEGRRRFLQNKDVKPIVQSLSAGERQIKLDVSYHETFVSYRYSLESILRENKEACEFTLNERAAVKEALQWLQDGFKQFNPNESMLYSTLCPESFEENGRLFLEVYTLAKSDPSPRREEMLYRLLLWKKFAQISENRSSFLNMLVKIMHFPEKFPPLVQADASELDLLKFLKLLDVASYQCTQLPMTQLPRVLDQHDPALETQYPIPIDRTFEAPLKPLSTVFADKIPLQVVYDAQTGRWQQFKKWKELLTEDLNPKVEKGEDFYFDPEKVLKDNEANYKESVKRDFDLLNQDYQKGKEQNLATKPKRLSKEGCKVLKNQAQDERDALGKKRQNLEIQLLAKVNQYTVPELMQLAGKVNTWMNFQECVDCLLSFDARSYIRKNGNLTVADANEIAQLTLQILDLKSHEAQLSRVIGLANEIQASFDQVESAATYRSLCRQMEAELSNHYHFDAGFNAEEQAVMRIFAGQGSLIPFKKQLDLIRKMLQADPKNPENFQDIVIQLIMGGGKTSVIATLMLILAAKRKDRLAFFIVPAALHKTVTANLGDGLQKAFGKELLSIDLERDAFTTHRLETVLKLLEQAEQNQQPIIISAATLQGFELELLSVVRQIKKVVKKRENAVEKEPVNENERNEWNAALKLLKSKALLLNKILRTTESKADSLIDEVDLILNSLQELNFVDGEKIAIHTGRNGLLLSIYKSLLSKKLTIDTLPGRPSVDDVIRLSNLQRPHQNPNDYLLHVVPVLARNLASTYKPFMQALPEAHKNSFVRYASGLIPAALETCMHAKRDLTGAYAKENFPKQPLAELKSDLEFLRYLHGLKNSHRQKDQELADLIAISKHFLTELTPACLPKEGERDFGSDPKNPGKIIPYVGILAPASTEFGYHWENVAYHYQYGAAFKPEKEMIFSLASLWTSTAKHFVIENGEKFEETPEYLSFLKLFGVKLDAIHEAGEVETAIENIFKDREKCLDLQFELAGRYANYASERLTSNGLALCDLLASRLSMSGTPWNAEGYDQRLAQRIIQDAGTEGRILHKLAERASADKILEVDQPKNIQEFLAQVYARYKAQNRSFSKVRGIIEAGGLFKGFGNNSTIAKGWMDFIAQKQAEEKGQPEKTVDPSIEAVLFFGSDPGQMEQNTLYAWRKGSAQPERIGGTTLDILLAKGLDPTKYVVLIDEVHGTGTDIPQKVDAVNIVTYDDMTTRKATQNIMRCRKFLLEQDVDFVIDKETRLSLHQQGQSVQDLFVNAAKKQSVTKTESMVRYFMQQIHHVFRKHAIQLVRESIDQNAMDDSSFAKCVEKAEKFFVTCMEELPFEQHGRLMDEVDTKKMLLALLEHKHHSFKQLIDLPKVLENVEKDVQVLAGWIKESNVLPAKWKNLSDAIGIEQEVEQQVQIQQLVETKVEIEVEIQNELKQYLKGMQSGIRREKKMTLSTFQALLREMQTPEKSAQVISLKKQLSQYEYKFDGVRFPYQECFAEPIYGTDAYFHTCTSMGVKETFSIFHPTQRPPKQILAVRHEGQMSWLLLSEHEARDAAKHLETLYQDKNQTAPEAWLIQPDGSIFVKGPEQFPLMDAPVVKGLIEVNALAGHISYLNARANRDEFSTWLDDKVDSRTELKIRFLKLRALQDETQKEHLARCEPIAILSNGKKMDTQTKSAEKFVCKLRRKKAKFFQGNLVVAKPEDVKLLPQLSVGQLKVTQVPLLGIDAKAQDPITQEALQKLAKELKLEGAESISKAAEAHTKKQFFALQSFQVPYLSPAQMPWLPKSKVRYIVEPEQIYLDIKHEDAKQSDKIMRKYLLSKEQVSGLKKEQHELIPFINPAFYLEFDEKWQIASIPVEHLHQINPKQAHHITPAQIQQFTADFMKKNPEVVGALTSEQLRLIDAKVLKFVPESRYKDLTAKQFTPKAMKKNPSIVAALTVEELQLIDPKSLHLVPENRYQDLTAIQIEGFNSEEYNQLPDDHWLWKKIAPAAISFLAKDKIKHVTKGQYCHLSPENKDVISSLSKWDFIYLNKNQLAKRKASFALYFLGVMTLGVVACVISAIFYVSVPLVWLIDKEKGRRYHRGLSLSFRRLGHLFSTYVPALFS